MKRAFRLRAIKLRQAGWSYNVIKERLGVSKSTLSHWLRDVPYEPNIHILQRIKSGTVKSNAIRHQAKMGSIAAARQSGIQDVGMLTKRDLFLLGLGIYIGEGSKLYEQTNVINANPDVIRLAMQWFREILQLQQENFFVILHIYPDTSKEVALRYWSKVTNLPISQFGKVYIDLRENKSIKKYRSLPYGTAHIRIRSCGNPALGVLLHRRIMGWIEAAFAQTRV